MRLSSTEVPGSGGEVPIVNNHRMIEEGGEEAVIGAFLAAHEGHTQDVEVQRGTWSIYCCCKRCGEIHTYEVDNEAREQVLGVPLWQEGKNKLSQRSHRSFSRSLVAAKEGSDEG
jgi:hypothetical protein